MQLIDENGLYEHLDLYLKIARPRILRGRKSPALFVGSRKHARFSEGALDQLCRRLFAKHLIHNPLSQTGFPGLFCAAGWHAWRHILATGILKKAGKEILAADAIQDSIEIVRLYYACCLPHDRMESLLELRKKYLGGD